MGPLSKIACLPAPLPPQLTFEIDLVLALSRAK